MPLTIRGFTQSFKMAARGRLSYAMCHQLAVVLRRPSPRHLVASSARLLGGRHLGNEFVSVYRGRVLATSGILVNVDSPQ